MSAESYQRYFIAIIPPPPVFDEALILKNYFKEKYNSKGALNSPPHITLREPFEWMKDTEELLVEILNEFVKEKKAITVELTGFGAFPPRVIFINVKRAEALNLLQTQLQSLCEIRLNLQSSQYKDRSFQPHLTLAFRDLKKESFAEAWNEFQGKSFSATFIADRFTLLKHDGRLWQPLHHFVFNS